MFIYFRHVQKSPWMATLALFKDMVFSSFSMELSLKLGASDLFVFFSLDSNQSGDVTKGSCILCLFTGFLPNSFSAGTGRKKVHS